METKSLPPKPQPRHVTWTRCEGNYNWSDEKEVSAQYTFFFPNGQPASVARRSYVIKMEYDFNPYESEAALDIARQLQTAIDRYWINSDKERIKALIAWLEANEQHEENNRLRYAVELTAWEIEDRVRAHKKAKWDLEAFLDLEDGMEIPTCSAALLAQGKGAQS